MPLTDVAVRTVKPAEKPIKLSDAGGLFLLVTPAGGRYWRLKYRIEGREKLLAIGPYPLVSLRDAREARDQAKRLLIAGIDPSAAKRESRQRAAAAVEHTFRVLGAEYLAKLAREGRAAATLTKVEWLLGLAYPELGARPIGEIRPPEVLAVLRTVEARGRHETARRLRSTIGSVFRFAIATARAESDPTSALKGALTRPVVTPRAAVLETRAFGALLRAVWAYDGSPETVAGLKLLALLVPRPGELRHAEWSEVDMVGGVWTVPASRTKMRREHRVPLPRQALQILGELHALTGRGRLLLPSVRSLTRPISENTLNAALRRLGYAADEATGHGFRASFSTFANESGLWHPDAIERALAHADGDSVRRAYARGAHWQERIRLSQWWADECDRMKASGKDRR